MKKQVAIIGIQGVPARYGGFETLVENIIGENCSKEIDYTIFCSQKEMTEKLDTYKGCKLKYVNLKSNGISSIPYDIISMIKSIRGFDSILVLGTSGCIFTPILKLLSKSKLIINIDGLEHRRGKWNKFAKKYLRFSEYMAVKFADVIISDNKAIQEYVKEVYGKDSVMIPYGGNHVAREISNDENTKVLLNYGLEPQNYSISICRIEPENNCHTILEAFSQSESKLVFIGNWNHSEYSKQLKKKYSTCENILLITSLYDLDQLYILRSNAKLYVHGHSAGGTNPSLVEAMYFNVPIACFDVNYNRNTTNNNCYYFKDKNELLTILKMDDIKTSPEIKAYAEKVYHWKRIAECYENLY